MCLQLAVLEAACTPNSESGIQLFPWGPQSAPQHEATRTLNCVCEHLYFVSICSVHLLAKRVLRYQKSLREEKLLLSGKNFLGIRLVSNNSVFQHNKENLKGEILARKCRFPETNSMRQTSSFLNLKSIIMQNQNIMCLIILLVINSLVLFFSMLSVLSS